MASIVPHERTNFHIDCLQVAYSVTPMGRHFHDSLRKSECLATDVAASRPSSVTVLAVPTPAAPPPLPAALLPPRPAPRPLLSAPQPRPAAPPTGTAARPDDVVLGSPYNGRRPSITPCSRRRTPPRFARPSGCLSLPKRRGNPNRRRCRGIPSHDGASNASRCPRRPTLHARTSDGGRNGPTQGTGRA